MGKLFEEQAAGILDPEKRAAFEKRIDRKFADEQLLVRAFTHSSYSNEREEAGIDYERLEFLGDAVLETVVSDWLYHAYPDLREGELTKKRAAMVCEGSLSQCAVKLELGELMLLGRGEDQSGGRKREAILADMMEAIAGAIYLDAGFDAAASFIRDHILSEQEHLIRFYDAKTELQVLVQGQKLGDIVYNIVDASGPEHRRVFTAEVSVGGRKYGTGSGSSKKAAEQHAAAQALEAMSRDGKHKK